MIVYVLSDLFGYLVWCKIIKIILVYNFLRIYFYRLGYMQMLENFCKSFFYQNGLWVF